ncbi:MAG TPA: hypothetical protein VK968_02165 [Roseimicrobium sp.]|nr:hypothetical protein [Roseimicrobium sp.]
MKTKILLFAVAILTLSGNAFAQQTFEAKESREKKQNTLHSPKNPNAPIQMRKATYDGALVKASRGNPLQLINPFAPAEYGTAEDNVVRDLSGKKVEGVAVFRIRF